MRAKFKSLYSGRSRIFNALSWVFAGYVMGQSIRLVGNLVLTRLLVPEMFGIMTIANLLMIGVELLSDAGIRQNIIRNQRGTNADFLNAAWTLQIFRGGSIWFLLIVAAITIDYFANIDWWPDDSVYSNQILPYVIGAFSFNAFIKGFTSTKFAIAHRDLSYGEITRIELLSQSFGLAVMIALAFFYHSIWALVIGSYFSTCLRVILSHVILKGENNRINLDREILWELIHFGKWILLSSAVGYIASSGDRLILGLYVGPETIGIYSIAFFFVLAIQKIIVKVSTNVAYPVFCETVRERPDDLKKVYYTFRKPIDSVALFMTGLLFISGQLLIDFLYDDRYSYAGYILEVLSISIIAMRFRLTGQALLAIGKPNLLLLISGVRAVAIYTLMPIAFFRYGLEGAIWAAGGSVLFTIPVIFVLKVKFGLFDLKKEVVTLPLLLVGYFVGKLLIVYF